jgi:hypothetical protein
MTRQTPSMTKVAEDRQKMIFRVLSKCGRRPAALPITGACRPDIASCRVAHVQERSATIWLPPNRKRQRSMSSSMYGRFSASSSTRHSTSRRVSVQHPMKTKAAQNFKMGTGINFQMRLEI